MLVELLEPMLVEPLELELVLPGSVVEPPLEPVLAADELLVDSSVVLDSLGSTLAVVDDVDVESVASLVASEVEL